VTYHEKRNLANLEENRDGESHNNNWNCGVEGETDDPAINQLRLRQRRNLMATLLLSQGVPMLRGGDELSHSQQGNNNAYCQDNRISWLNWDLDKDQQEFLQFCRQLTAIWHTQPVLKRRNFFQGRKIRGAGVKDIAWLTPAGTEITDHEWRTGAISALGMRLNGESMDEVDDHGQPIIGDSLVILWNANPDAVAFTMPKHKPAEHWALLFDTSLPNDTEISRVQGETYPLPGRSVVAFVLRSEHHPERHRFHLSHRAFHHSHDVPPRPMGNDTSS
jgi:glycogen operon protein